MNRLVIAVSIAALLAGCGKKNAPELQSDQSYATKIKEKVLAEEGLVLVEVDLNTDGSADVQNYYKERENGTRMLVMKKLDLNFDGSIDLVSYFNDEGDLAREEMDSDFDGTFDWTDHYQNGNRVMSEYDTESDGRPNVFKYFSAGEENKDEINIDRKERDTDGDGKIDVWERFAEDGTVIRSGRDTDGDGKLDERDE